MFDLAGSGLDRDIVATMMTPRSDRGGPEARTSMEVEINKPTPSHIATVRFGGEADICFSAADGPEMTQIGR